MFILDYFRTPFPSRQGFSAYRMPGPSVHLPVILCAGIVGYLLCWPHPVLRLLLLVWIVAGVYLGRDFAIICHYALPLALVAWIALFLLAAKGRAIARFGDFHPLISVLLSVGVTALQVIVANLLMRKASAIGEQQSAGK